MRKHTLDEVRVIFVEGGCEFLDDSYIGAHHPHNYRCSCGRTAKIKLGNFNSGSRCSNCGGNKKKTLDEVRVIFTEGGCEFLDDNYVNNNHPHNYRCSCGREAKISLGSFNSGSRCSDCGGSKKKTLNEVRVIFTEGGCEFLDDNYVNNNHPHNYRCSCGRMAKISLNNFNKGKRCSDCGGSKKKTLNEVRVIFTEGGCEFLDDSYVNAHHRHNYRCSCGREAKISLDNFNRGHRCSGCAGYGFKNSKPSYFYLISRPNQYKVGIYNEGSDRLIHHKRNGWKLLEQVGPLCGNVVSELESVVVRGIRDKGILMGSEAFVEEFDGWTESWQAVDLEVSSLPELFSYLRIEF
jgi:predicted nucleic acid-binding Zn ribbon protein